jgi:hypothetical protein
MAAVDESPAQNPDRAALVNSLCGLLKVARRPLEGEDKRYGLDNEGRRLIWALARRLSAYLHFEHHTTKELEADLRGAIDRYRAHLDERPRPDLKDFAGGVLDGLAADPTVWTAYLGVRDLGLPPDMSVGSVRFMDPHDEAGLVEDFQRASGAEPGLVCVTQVLAGTSDLAIARARQAAEGALALIRQKMLFGFMAKMHPGQLAFDVDGRYVLKVDGATVQSGWWAEVTPIYTDLSGLTEWAQTVTELSQQREALSPNLRERVDTSLEWLDVAASARSWRTMLPAVFSAMEALLVPETSGLKAGAVTVRSVAVHVALGEGFFHPAEIIAGYEWRSRLVHGSPTAGVNEAEFIAFSENRRLWAFRVFTDYLRLAPDSGVATVAALVAHIDKNVAPEVCRWLRENGGDEIVDEYEAMLAH